MTLAPHHIFIVITIHYVVCLFNTGKGNQGKICVLNEKIFEHIIVVLVYQIYTSTKLLSILI